MGFISDISCCSADMIDFKALFCLCGRETKAQRLGQAKTKLTLERLNCPECGTFKEGVLVYNDGRNVKGQVEQKDERLITYSFFNDFLARKSKENVKL